MSQRTSYGDHPLEHWLQELAGNSDHQRTQALWAIRDIAVDFPERARQCAEILLSAVDDFSDAVRWAATNALGIVLARERPDHLKESPPRYTRPADFDDLVAAALPRLIRESGVQLNIVRSGAVSALRQIRVPSAEVMAALIQRLDREDDADVQTQVLYALEQFGAQASEALPNVLRWLNRRNFAWHVRAAAARALTAMAPGSEALRADMARVAAAEDTPPELRDAIRGAMESQRTGPGA